MNPLIIRSKVKEVQVTCESSYNQILSEGGSGAM